MLFVRTGTPALTRWIQRKVLLIHLIHQRQQRMNRKVHDKERFIDKLKKRWRNFDPSITICVDTVYWTFHQSVTHAKNKHTCRHTCQRASPSTLHIQFPQHSRCFGHWRELWRTYGDHHYCYVFNFSKRKMDFE